MTPQRRRRLLRLIHLVAAIPLMLHLYGPDSVSDALRPAVRLVVVPLVAASGVAIWQLPRVTRRWRERRRRR